MDAGAQQARERSYGCSRAAQKDSGGRDRFGAQHFRKATESGKVDHRPAGGSVGFV
jgi:hypothetical protein